MEKNRTRTILHTVAILFSAFGLFVACTPVGQEIPGMPLDTPTESSAAPGIPAAAPGPENGSLKIFEVSPAQVIAGNEVIALIHGAGFKPWLKVRFGDVESTNVKVFDESMLTAVIPQQPPGSWDVTLSDAADGTERLVALQGALTILGELPPGSDKDNLPTDIEVNGWDIEVDRFGFGLDPSHIIRYTVTSDPDLDDTDGDGLSDAEEYLNRTNPRNVDTDGDGLWDSEEINRWGTSPVTVDTDGDASGAAAGGGISATGPYASMFDGMELYNAAELILPPSQRGRIKPDATSPSLDDTDGDGASDSDEDPSTVRRPLFADLPKLRARIVDAVDVRLDVEYGEEQGQTTGYSSELSTTSETTEGRSEAETDSVSVTTGFESQIGTAESSVSFSVEFGYGYESSVETTKESTQSASETYGSYSEDSRVKTETAATGSMSAGLEILNEGNIAFRLTSLGMAVRQLQPNRDPLNLSTPPEFKTLATLVPDLSNGLTLAPGATSGVIQVQATDVNADRVKSLLANASRMYINPAVFEIENAEGINFAFIQEVTAARTARVLIDFADGNPIDARVATNVDRKEDGSLAGISLASVMDLLVGADKWDSRPTNDQQPSTVTPVEVIDGSFESPQFFHSSGPPQFWTANNSNLVWAQNFIPLAPEGHQWLQIQPNGYAYQQIGNVSDNGVYQFSFVQASLNPTNTVSVELWRFEPGSPLSLILDSKSFTLSNNSPPTTQTGTLSAGLGHNGLPLFIVVRQTGGDVAYVDNLSVQAFSSNPKVLWRINDFQNKLDSQPRLWRVYVNAADQQGKDFDDIALHFGDAVIIALTEDADSDGLSSVQEQHYGTSDSSADSDGDGLSDALETRGEYRVPALPSGDLRQGGWTVTVTGKPPYRVFSDPTRVDSDGDGLTDRQEYLGKDGIAPGAPGEHNDATDPLLTDTDGDGITDGLDLSIIPATVLYVKSGATGANNGQNWTDAYTQLSSAFTTARTRNTDADLGNDIGEIWVAQGVYIPATLNTAFSIPPRVTIYGGFAGGETKLSQRSSDAVTNGTVLHANGAGIVSAVSPLPGSSVLDGFMLEGTAGNNPALSINFTSTSDSLSVKHCFFYNNIISGQLGAAARAVGTITNGVANTIRFEDCMFANNRVTGPYAVGAAISSWTCNPQITRCTFFGNTTDSTQADATTGTNGGAVWLYRSPAFLVDNCRFEQNLLAAGGIATSGTASGGALSIVSLSTLSTGTVSNCIFRNNEVESELTTNPGVQWWSNRAGGALSTCVNQNSGSVTINVINCAFWQNRAQCFGGAAFVGPSTTAKFVNCTFNRNVLTLLPSTTSNCGSQQILDSFAVGAGIGALGSAIVDNCILWGNIGSDTFRTRPGGGGAIVTRTLGQEKQISPRPYWLTVVECFGPAGTLSFNNSCVEKVGLDTHFTGSVGGLGNFNLDPLLVSQDTGNLLLTSGSPCIDSGNDLVDSDILKGGLQFLPAIDLAAKARKADGNGDGQENVDIGAYEFQP